MKKVSNLCLSLDYRSNLFCLGFPVTKVKVDFNYFPFSSFDLVCLYPKGKWKNLINIKDLMKTLTKWFENVNIIFVTKYENLYNNIM